MSQEIGNSHSDLDPSSQDGVHENSEPIQPEETEASPEDVSTNEVINLLRELKEEGVDFEEEDIELILGNLDAEESLGYLIFALEQAGFEDPEAYLKEKGILE